jgi:hypothetical protein
MQTPAQRKHAAAIHRRLLAACEPAAHLPDTADWYSARIAAAIERQGRDPWSLTLAELRDLMCAAMPQEPRT